MFSVRSKNALLPDCGQATGSVVYVLSDGEPRADEWLATLSHELRSPLTTILYALETISGTHELDSSARRACHVADRQARKVMQLVENLFDVCAGSQGKLTIQRKAVDLATVVAGAAETVGLQLATRGHRLTVSLPSERVSLYADPLRLEQVLTNLLNNAAKFTDPGGLIRLTAEVEGGHVAVRVRDNGRGIAPDVLPRVFDLFQQGLHTGERVTGGLGIGLTLVKSLVELHGGSVSAFSSGPGAGSEFVVRLPVEAEEP